MKTNVVVKLSDRALGAKVDKLAGINASIAALKKAANEIKEILIDSGEAEIWGSKHKAVIVGKTSVLFSGAIAKSFLTSKQIAACEREVDSISVSLYDL